MKRKHTREYWLGMLPSQQDYEECGLQFIEPRRIGYADSEPGESGYKYVVFSRTAVEAVFGTVTDDNAQQVLTNLTGWHQSWSGAGRGFQSEPSIRVFKRNILIKQFTGLDI